MLDFLNALRFLVESRGLKQNKTKVPIVGCQESLGSVLWSY